MGRKCVDITLLLGVLGYTTALSGVASLTYYQSYAPCCPGEVNYDPSADTAECDLYNACTWTGQFAALTGKQSYEFVKNSSLIAFFDRSDGSIDSFMRDYAGKNITLVKDDGNIVFDAVIVDTCGDSDCNGCCSMNSAETGYLVDLEYYTMLRNFDHPNNASGLIEFYIDEPYPPPVNDGDGDGEDEDGIILLVSLITVCLLVIVIVFVLWCFQHWNLYQYVCWTRPLRPQSESTWKSVSMHQCPPSAEDNDQGGPQIDTPSKGSIVSRRPQVLPPPPPPPVPPLPPQLSTLYIKESCPDEFSAENPHFIGATK